MPSAPVMSREQTGVTGELSDEQLDQVTGGILPITLAFGGIGAGVALAFDGAFGDLVDWIGDWFD